MELGQCRRAEPEERSRRFRGRSTSCLSVGGRAAWKALTWAQRLDVVVSLSAPSKPEPLPCACIFVKRWAWRVQDLRTMSQVFPLNLTSTALAQSSRERRFCCCEKFSVQPLVQPAGRAGRQQGARLPSSLPTIGNGRKGATFCSTFRQPYCSRVGPSARSTCRRKFCCLDAERQE